MGAYIYTHIHNFFLKATIKIRQIQAKPNQNSSATLAVFSKDEVKSEREVTAPS